MDEENFSEEAVVVEPETTEEATLETPEESIEQLKTQLEDERIAREKAEKAYQDQKGRNERVEAQLKKAKETATGSPTVGNQSESKDGLSIKDSIAILNAKVHEDDVDEVLEYAKFKKISISEALKSNVVKASLAEKAEHRETAEQTSTGKVRSGNTARTGDSLLAKALEKGELPDSDADLDKMLATRYGGK